MLNRIFGNTGWPGSRSGAYRPARHRVANFDLVAEAPEVPGAGKPGRTGADNQHFLAGRRARRNRPALLDGHIADEPFDRMDGHRLVQVLAIAARFTRVVTGAAMGAGQRVVGDQRLPRLLEVTFAGVSQPALDVLAGRAGAVARWKMVDPRGILPALRTCALLDRRPQDRRQSSRTKLMLISL